MRQAAQGHTAHGHSPRTVEIPGLDRHQSVLCFLRKRSKRRGKSARHPEKEARAWLGLPQGGQLLSEVPKCLMEPSLNQGVTSRYGTLTWDGSAPGKGSREAEEERGVHRPAGSFQSWGEWGTGHGGLVHPSFILGSRAGIEGFMCGAVRVQFVLWKNCFRSETSVRSG